ncbi:armadillo-type protein [Zopfochytrium polystomum]|nr:armadillo-type protein [Zopfochytrium polystomum]
MASSTSSSSSAEAAAAASSAPAPAVAVYAALQQTLRPRRRRFPEALVRIALDPALDLSERQSAAIVLKNYIPRNWQEKGCEDFVGPEPTPQVKSAIRSMVLQGLSDSNPRIPALMAVVATRISRVEGVENWPELVAHLVANLQSGVTEKVSGAMIVFAELVEDISQTEFLQLSPSILPLMRLVLCSPQAFPADTRSLCVAVFSKFVETMSTISDIYPETTERSLSPILPEWMAAFKDCLQVQDLSAEQFSLKKEIFEAIERLSENFMSRLKPFLVDLVPLLWRNLKDPLPRFLESIVTPNDEADLDLDPNDITLMLFSLFTLLDKLLEKKAFKQFVATRKSPTPFFTDLVTSSILYAQITTSQLEAWTADPNSFVSEEDETALTFTLRFAVDNLMETAHGSCAEVALPTLMRTCEELVQLAAQKKSGGSADWWKPLESVLHCVMLSYDLLIPAIEGKTVSFNMDAFLATVIKPSISAHDCPLLQGRALLFSSHFRAFIPSAELADYIRDCVAALTPQQAFPARVCAMKALWKFARDDECVQLLRPYCFVIMEAICSVIPTAADDFLLLLLETLMVVVKIDEAATRKVEEELSNLLVGVWMRDSEDPIKNDIVLDVFAAMSKTPETAAALQQRLLPSLTKMIAERTSVEGGMIHNCLILMTSLARNAPTPLPPVYVQLVFPALLEMLLLSDKVEGSQIVLDCQDVLRTLIVKDFESIIRWSSNGKTGISYVLDVLSTLLHPERSDSQIEKVGELIVSVLVKGGDAVTGILPDLVAAMVKRLATAELLNAIKSLLTAFARLAVETPPAALLDMLAAVRVAGAGAASSSSSASSASGDAETETGVRVLLRVWSHRYEEISGHYWMKLSCVGIAKLLLAGDPRVEAVLLPGDPAPSERVKTRSQARNKPDQYTMIPFPAKAMKLLIKEYEEQRTASKSLLSAGGGGGFGFEEDDERTGDTEDSRDDEWEDEDDDDEVDELGGGGGGNFGFSKEWLDGEFDDDDDDDEVDDELVVEYVKSVNTQTPFPVCVPQEYIKDVLRACVARFGSLADHCLTAAEKKTLQAVLSAEAASASTAAATVS